MRMPGFTAEVSLHQTQGHYSTTAAVGFTRSALVLPQAWTDDSWCRWTWASDKQWCTRYQIDPYDYRECLAWAWEKYMACRGYSTP